MTNVKMISRKKADGTFDQIGLQGPVFVQQNLSPVLPPALEDDRGYLGITPIYVSPDGNDENDGQSIDKPLEHIGKALELRQKILGVTDIRLKASSTSGFINAYSLVSSIMPPALYESAANRVVGWDFDTDSALSDRSKHAAILPPDGVTQAFIQSSGIFENITMAHAAYSSEGLDVNARNCRWNQQAAQVIFKNSSILSLVAQSGLTFGELENQFYSSSTGASPLIVYQSGSFVQNSGSIYFSNSSSNGESIRVPSAGYCYIADAVQISGTTGGNSNLKKCFVGPEAYLHLGTSINSVPGTGTNVSTKGTLE